MTHILHVQFNKLFEADKALHDPHTQSAIINTVAECSADVIRNKYANARCPDLVNDKIRRRVTTENLYVFAKLQKYNLIFLGVREIGKRVPVYDN